jgi:hypothetical protein
VRTIRIVLEGLAAAARHPRLVLLLWLVPLLPALAVALLISSVLEPFDRRPFAARILEGQWVGPWIDFLESPFNHLDSALGPGVFLALGIGVVAQIVVAAGLVEVLLRGSAHGAFFTGIRRNGWRFARAAGWLVVMLGLLAVPPIVLARVCFKLAESTANGWLDVAGVVGAAVLAIVLAAPVLMAYDQSRLAAAAYSEGSMLLGLLRSLVFVVRHPLRFGALALLTGLLPLTVHLAYGWVRAAWVPSTAFQILMLLLVQQSVMLVRAYLKLGLWAAHVGMWRELGSPRLARRRRPRSPAPLPPNL